ncbi:MAG: phosphatase PAP2 family protein [Pseudomonadota bacterium]|nr:phosphatase PAP2 family protein [Pseudomonadota bacterium]
MLKFPWIVYFLLPMLLLIWIYKKKSYALKILISSLIIVGICDLVGFQLLKATFERPRPHHTDIGAIVRVPYAPKSYSFPSNHALNTAALAQNLAFYYPAAAPYFYLFALFMAYSRVYVGVHFPLDVIAGGIIGLLLAIFIRWVLFKKIKWLERAK